MCVSKCEKHWVRASHLPSPSLSVPMEMEGQRLSGLFVTADALGARPLATPSGNDLHFGVGSRKYISSPSKGGEQSHTPVPPTSPPLCEDLGRATPQVLGCSAFS